nr:hypothetical protein [Tanacetum cinerariifolium]
MPLLRTRNKHTFTTTVRQPSPPPPHLWLLTTANKYPFRVNSLHSQTHHFLVVGGVGVAMVMETVTVDSGVVWWRLMWCAVCGGGSDESVVGDEWWRQRGSGVTRWCWRMEESGVEDRVDRETRNLFGFAEKIPPEKFSGGGRVVAGGA